MNFEYIFSILTSVLSLTQSVSNSISNTCDLIESDRVDCGYVGIGQTECEQANCCWSPVINTNVATNTPWCYKPENTCYNLLEQMQEPFDANQMELINGYFDANLNVQNLGGVAAAPDPNTPGGSYYYHWSRDGALAMRTIQETREFDDYEPILKSYTHWVLRTHDAIPYNKLDTRIEPKFELPYGEVYTGGWCRPQTDGPGLQAIALIMFANSLIDDNQTDWVREYLWTGNTNKYHGGAIKYDLDWIVSGGYKQSSCDLWEEIRANDLFWNQMAYHFTLTKAVKFAN
jgi:glucoamylase